jgi:TolB-like protein
MSIRSVLRAVTLSAAVVAIPLGAQQPVVSQPGASDSRPTVAVLYFTNGALLSNADYAPLSKGMAEMMITELSRNPGVRVVERDRLQQLLAEQNLGNGDRVDKETAVRIGKILGAHHLLMGSFVIDPKQNMRIDVRSVNTETSQIEYVETVDGKADQMLSLVSALGAKVNAGLKLPAIPVRVPGMGDAGTGVAQRTSATKVDQLRAVMALSKGLEAQDRGDIQGAVAMYRQAVDAYPDFERAKTLLASLETGQKKTQTP